MIAVVATWNFVASSLLMECKSVCNNVAFPSHLSSTYSKMAYAGAGHLGVLVTDMSIIVTLLGVCIAFQITFATLLHEVPGRWYAYCTVSSSPSHEPRVITSLNRFYILYRKFLIQHRFDYYKRACGVSAELFSRYGFHGDPVFSRDVMLGGWRRGYTGTWCTGLRKHRIH